MEKIKCFNSAKEFNELFKVRTYDGKPTRTNGILLSHLKSKDTWSFCKRYNDWRLLSVKSLKEVYTTVLRMLRDAQYKQTIRNVCLMEYRYPCYGTETDASKGMPISGYNVRYVDTEQDRKVYEMKPGKMMRKIIKSSALDFALCEQVKTYVCEMFSEEWKAYLDFTSNEYKLCVEDSREAFRHIYDRNSQVGDFHSCMNGSDCYTFYANHVDAKAAYLYKGDDQDCIYARCVLLYVHDAEDDTEYWVAERQYCTDSDTRLERILVQKLYEGGYIKYHKAIGAGCSSSRAFEDREGNSHRNDMYIEVSDMSEVDFWPYMDSFKWLGDDGRAYNCDDYDPYCDLENTNGDYERLDEEDCACIRNGHTVYVTETERDEDYTYIRSEDEYIHNDEVGYCSRCDEPYAYGYGDHVYSEFMDDDYCCYSCMLYDVKDTVLNFIRRESYDDLEGSSYEEHYIYVYSEDDEAYRKMPVLQEVWDAIDEYALLPRFDGEYYTHLNTNGEPITDKVVE